MPAYSISDEERLADSRAAMRLIMPDVLEVEREVAHEKWFAYRFKSPLAATKLFASLYRQGFRKFIERHKDRGGFPEQQRLVFKPVRSTERATHSRLEGAPAR